jgi:hypothetical protein
MMRNHLFLLFVVIAVSCDIHSFEDVNDDGMNVIVDLQDHMSANTSVNTTGDGDQEAKLSSIDNSFSNALQLIVDSSSESSISNTISVASSPISTTAYQLANVKPPRLVVCQLFQIKSCISLIKYQITALVCLCT